MRTYTTTFTIFGIPEGPRVRVEGLDRDTAEFNWSYGYIAALDFGMTPNGDVFQNSLSGLMYRSQWFSDALSDHAALMQLEEVDAT